MASTSANPLPRSSFQVVALSVVALAAIGNAWVVHAFGSRCGSSTDLQAMRYAFEASAAAHPDQACPDRLAVLSVGEDGREGTEDDLKSWE